MLQMGHACTVTDCYSLILTNKGEIRQGPVNLDKLFQRMDPFWYAIIPSKTENMQSVTLD